MPAHSGLLCVCVRKKERERESKGNKGKSYIDILITVQFIIDYVEGFWNRLNRVISNEVK